MNSLWEDIFAAPDDNTRDEMIRERWEIRKFFILPIDNNNRNLTKKIKPVNLYFNLILSTFWETRVSHYILRSVSLWSEDRKRLS